MGWVNIVFMVLQFYTIVDLEDQNFRDSSDFLGCSYTMLVLFLVRLVYGKNDQRQNWKIRTPGVRKVYYEVKSTPGRRKHRDEVFPGVTSTPGLVSRSQTN